MIIVDPCLPCGVLVLYLDDPASCRTLPDSVISKEVLYNNTQVCATKRVAHVLFRSFGYLSLYLANAQTENAGGYDQTFKEIATSQSHVCRVF